ALAHRRAFGTDVVARVQAPLAPLHHDAGRQVADLAQLAAGEIAEQRRRQRYQHVPEVQHHPLELRRVVAPVAAARRHRHHAGDTIAVLQQARQLRAEAVTDQVQRHVAGTLQRRGDDRIEVVGPAEQISIEAAQRAAIRVAHAAVVEARNQIALRREPLRERGVVVLLDAHRAADDDRGLDRRRRFVEARRDGDAIGRVEVALLHVVALQTRSKIAAAPCPVPTHIVTMPYFRLWRRSACTTVAARIAPVAPSGWPNAIAPPIGLALAGSRPMLLITASDCAANASLSSIQSMSARLRPAYRSAAGIASIGPMPMISGGTPRAAKLTKRASGFRSYCLMAFSLARISAPAPSLVCELLPAVTLPLAANTGFSFARPSSEVSGRGPSSSFTVRVF